MPIRFEENRGQFGVPTRFVARCGTYDALFSTSEVLVAPAGGGGPVRLRLGSGATTRLEGFGSSGGTCNYLRGRDKRAWRTSVPTYSSVRYSGVAEGIDAVFYASDDQLEYDLVLAPGADPDSLTIAFEGATSVEIDASGALVARTCSGELRQEIPRIYQDTARGKRSIAGRYVLEGPNRVGIRIGAYDHTRPLVADPQLAYSARFGASGIEYPTAVAVDPGGAIFLAGLTNSPDLPVVGALDGSLGGEVDALVAKLNADGRSLAFATYIGGSSDDFAAGIALDKSGDIWVDGSTSSVDFPTTPGAAQPNLFGGLDGFVAKLSHTGDSIVSSTYLGGSSDDFCEKLALGPDGNPVVTGFTMSQDFPTANAFQRTYGGGVTNAFVTKLDASESRLLYSSYLGAGAANGGADVAYGLAVDADGNVLIGGTTSSSDYPILNAIQASLRGPSDGFVAKVSPAGQPSSRRTLEEAPSTTSEVSPSTNLATSTLPDLHTRRTFRLSPRSRLPMPVVKTLSSRSFAPMARA